MNSKRIIYIVSLLSILIITVSGLLWYFSKNNQQQNIGNTSTLEKLQIATSIYPIYEFTRQVAGDLANVTNITPVGVEPHEYEPSAQQVAQTYEKKLIIYNGSGVDPWADKLSQELGQRGVTVVNMSQELNSDLLDTEEDGATVKDPHFWLDPVLAQKEIDIIANKMSQIDQKNSVIYQNNAKSFKQKLSDLDADYTKLLSQCTQKTAVTSHNAFGYLSKRYNFELLSIAGIDPEGEPSPSQIAELITLVKDKKIKYIAFESLVNPKLSETIAQETGAQTIILNPIEGLTQDQLKDGQDYISISKDNLTSLRSMLDCK